jgi:predicted hotdog family 3-hydroxylacyl-ACP dehydratase
MTTPQPLDHDWIAGRIPHHGKMCVLDGVHAWDDEQIRCRATSHRHPDNPLRRDGRLGVAAGIEYAAQAMAVHGSLVTPREGKPTLGYLASVRGVELCVERLDDIAAPLDIEARRLSGNDTTILYSFTVSADGRRLLSGRAAVLMAPGRPA